MIQINNHKLLCGDITKGAVDIVMGNEIKKRFKWFTYLSY